MKPPSRKRITITVALLGAGVLTVAWFAFKERLLEQWYLWRLESEDVDTRKTAAEKLAEMGSIKALPALFDRAGTETSLMFRFAILDIASQRGSEIVSIIAERLKDENWNSRDAAAEALGAVGPDAREAVSILKETLADPHDEVRKASAWALGEILGINADVMELLSENNVVVIGRIQNVQTRTDRSVSRRMRGWAVTVKSEEVLRGGPLPWDTFQVYVHSPIKELGLDINGQFNATLMLWLLRVENGRVTKFCSQLDTRFNPSDFGALQDAIDSLST